MYKFRVDFYMDNRYTYSRYYVESGKLRNAISKYLKNNRGSVKLFSINYKEIQIKVSW